MAFVNRIEVDGASFENPSIDAINRHLEGIRIKADSHLSLCSDDEDFFLLIYYIKSQGYYVTGSGLGDSEFYVLSDSEKNSATVEVWLDGNFATIELNRLVDKEKALMACEEFFHSGRRHKRLEWVVEG